MPAVKITLMLTDSCTHHDDARTLLREAIAESGAEAAVIEVIVRTDEEAKRAGVIGSPTIQVEGLDVEYADRAPDETSNGCRYYNSPAGWKPYPEQGMIVSAIKRAQGAADG